MGDQGSEAIQRTIDAIRSRAPLWSTKSEAERAKEIRGALLTKGGELNLRPVDVARIAIALVPPRAAVDPTQRPGDSNDRSTPAVRDMDPVEAILALVDRVPSGRREELTTKLRSRGLVHETDGRGTDEDPVEVVMELLTERVSPGQLVEVHARMRRLDLLPKSPSSLPSGGVRSGEVGQSPLSESAIRALAKGLGVRVTDGGPEGKDRPVAEIEADLAREAGVRSSNLSMDALAIALGHALYALTYLSGEYAQHENSHWGRLAKAIPEYGQYRDPAREVGQYLAQAGSDGDARAESGLVQYLDNFAENVGRLLVQAPAFADKLHAYLKQIDPVTIERDHPKGMFGDARWDVFKERYEANFNLKQDVYNWFYTRWAKTRV